MCGCGSRTEEYVQYQQGVVAAHTEEPEEEVDAPARCPRCGVASRKHCIACIDYVFCGSRISQTLHRVYRCPLDHPYRSQCEPMASPFVLVMSHHDRCGRSMKQIWRHHHSCKQHHICDWHRTQTRKAHNVHGVRHSALSSCCSNPCSVAVPAAVRP